MDRELAIRKETEVRPKYGPRHVFVFKCKDIECQEEVRVRTDSLKTHSGYCGSHSHQKRTFESIYNRIKSSWRKTPVELTYEEFLAFTTEASCFYCGSIIPWLAYATINGEFNSAAYFLDRKNNAGPYSKENCVVCCTECNSFKGALNAEEFITRCTRVASRVGGSCGA